MGESDLIEPNDILPEKYSLYGAATLVTVPHNQIVLFRLLNISNMSVKLYGGTSPGRFFRLDPNATISSMGSEEDTGQDTKSENDLLFDLNESSLSPSEQQKLQELLRSYRDIFATGPTESGRTSIVQHAIDTGSSPTIRQRPYRASPEVQQEINEQVHATLDKKVIQPLVSPWSSPVVLVKKKDGSNRFCVDYRKLNAVTHKGSCSYSLPHIDDTLDRLQGTRFFSTMDLMSGYWQVELHPSAQEKTAFIIYGGLYEFSVMSLWLCNAPSTFQRLMESILRGLNWRTCLIYLDDVTVFSKTFDDHPHHLAEVSDSFREANIKLKPSKCMFGQSKVAYLGHVISSNGICPDPEKIKFPVPTNMRQIRSFLGLANYYRRFVKDFAKIASPLHDLTKKAQRFYWDDDCQQAFEHLKQILTEAPILAFPNYELPFYIYVDASADGLGATQEQQQNEFSRVIAYGGCKLSAQERNYSSTEREALAVLDGIKRFLSYLYGRKFYVITDHHSLRWLMNIKEPTGRLARWSLEIQQYDFEIVHRSGRSNANADVLSTYPYQSQTIAAISSAGFRA